jgi:hypothetical protein
MKKISNNDTFANYIGKFIDMDIEGTVRKFFVSEIEAGSITTNAGILYPDTFNIIRESNEQDCQICDDVCYQNVPVLKIIFTNYVYNNSDPEYTIGKFVNNYVDDTFDLYLNGNFLGRINTRDYKSPAPTEGNSLKRNEIWFIPNYNNNNIEVTYAYASASNRSSYYSYIWGGPINSLGLSSFDSSLFDKNYFNEIALVPVSCNNPTVCNENRCDYDPPLNNIFLTYPSITLDIHKIVIKPNGTSALSCVSYNMHQFDYLHGSGSLTDNTLTIRPNNDNYTDTPSIIGTSYFKEGLSAGSIVQPFSASFYYIDPCDFVSPPFYPLDANYYYNKTNSYTDGNYNDYCFAYALSGEPFPNRQPLNNPLPSMLRKYTFFNSPSLSDIKNLYVGENRKTAPFTSQNFVTVTDNPGIFKTRSPFFPFTPDFAGYTPLDIEVQGTNGPSYNFSNNAIYSDIFANELFEGNFYCLENRTNSGGSINFRRINVYLETVGDTLTQHLSVSNIVSL